jgi:long-chain acyl-CoA synthetase
MLHIVDAIFSNCDRRAIALISNNYEITFGELEQFVSEAARALEQYGAKSTGMMRIGLHCPNGIDHIVWSLAILRCNCVLVPIAPELSHAERDEVVLTTGLDAVLCAGGKHWHTSVPVTHTLVTGPWTAHFLLGIRDGRATEIDSHLSPISPALIRFSSGTTGQRKGVVLSHDALYARVTACNAGLRIRPGDRVVWTLPMAHHFAVSIVLYLLHGATTVIAANHSATEIQRTLTQHKGTVLYGAPYHHGMLASHPATTPAASLRLAVSTAAALPAETAARFYERLGVPLTQAMGIIEMGLPLMNLDHPLDKPGSVGRPQPAFTCKIVDESGRELPANEPGELLLRGPGAFDAYLSPGPPRKKSFAMAGSRRGMSPPWIRRVTSIWWDACVLSSM